MEKFWMVVGKNAGNPTQRHYDKRKALTEAQRLSKKDGDHFFILEAVAVVKAVYVEGEHFGEVGSSYRADGSDSPTAS